MKRIETLRALRVSIYAIPIASMRGTNRIADDPIACVSVRQIVSPTRASELTRAQETLEIVLKIMNQEQVTKHRSWRLNERMYGGLTALDKKATVEKYGTDQVQLWRRSYDIPPPPVDESSEYFPGNDNRYAHLPDADIPRSECLKDCVERTVPYWEQEIVPALMRGKTVLVAAHGNSIRGILKHIDGISDEDITGLEIPTGIPLVYQLDDDLKPIKSDRATGVLSGHFLANQEALAELHASSADGGQGTGADADAGARLASRSLQPQPQPYPQPP